MGRGWHAGHRQQGAGRLLFNIGRPYDRPLVRTDGKACELIGWKLYNRRTGSVQQDGYGGLADCVDRSGEKQTQRRGVNMNSAQHGGLLLSSVPDLRPTYPVEIGAELSWLGTAADREEVVCQGERSPRISQAG